MDVRFKEGVVLKGAHFRPHMTHIIRAALYTAPNLADDTVWITEGYRKIRETLDMHELCAAFDFRCSNIFGNIDTLGHVWAEQMGEFLGADYDVIAHGEGDNFHIHAEYDPR